MIELAKKIEAEIIRCKACGSSNLHLGHATVWGTPVLCRDCGHFEPTKMGIESKKEATQWQ